MAWLCAASGWPWSEVGAITIPEAQAIGRAWKKVPPLPLLLNGVVNALTGKTDSVEDDSVAKFEPGQQEKFDEWFANRMNEIQANGGMVSNMVVQAKGE